MRAESQTEGVPITTSRRTMEVYSNLSNAIARISVAWSSPQLWSSVKDFAAGFGYSHVAAFDLAKLASDVDQAVIYSDLPRPQINAFAREFDFAQNPMVQQTLRSPCPFLISELRNKSAEGDRRWSELLADVIKRGEGLSVPIYHGADAKAGINFGGDAPDTSALTRAMLQVVSHAAIDKMQDLTTGSPQTAMPSLSVREAQCLRWVAIGRADAEIGQILGISPRTVRFHVDSAKTKLGVTTRIQAVAKALREKIIAV